MTVFYDAVTRGFYRSEDGNVPDSAISISNEYYEELFEGQSTGKEIQPDENGYPVCVDTLTKPETYISLRLAEYPSIQEQLDMQYWDSINGTTTWQDAINAVKLKYPKE